MVSCGKPVGDGTQYAVPGVLVKKMMGRVVTDRQAYEKEQVGEK
jgi:hypothetical protein